MENNNWLEFSEINKNNNYNKSGIYCILNIKTGKHYIGSASCLRQRKNCHIGFLRKNKHINIYLQSAWNKYGEEAFKFYIVKFVSKKRLRKIESLYIRKYKSIDPNFGYNLSENTICPEWNEEKRLKQSLRMKGNSRSKGLVHSKETRDFLSQRLKGNQRRKGILHTPEKIEQMRKTHTGMKQSQLAIDNYKKAITGRVLNPETRKFMYPNGDGTFRNSFKERD